MQIDFIIWTWNVLSKSIDGDIVAMNGTELLFQLSDIGLIFPS